MPLKGRREYRVEGGLRRPEADTVPVLSFSFPDRAISGALLQHSGAEDGGIRHVRPVETCASLCLGGLQSGSGILWPSGLQAAQQGMRLNS